jgi:hypothetical protein
VSDVATRVEGENAALATREATSAPPPPDGFDVATAHALSDIVTHVPEIIQQPDAALAIAKNADNLEDPIATAQGLVHTQRVSDVQACFPQLDQQSQPQTGFWGSLGHDIAAVGSGIAGAFTDQSINNDIGAIPGVNKLTDQNIMGAVGTAAGGAYTAAASPMDPFSPLVKFQAQTAIPDELRVLGWTGEQIKNKLNIGGDAGGMTATITGNPQWGADVTKGINSAFDFPQHQYRLYSELQRTHGTAYAIKAVVPGLIAAALAGGSAVTPGGEELTPELAAVAAETGISEADVAAAAESVAESQLDAAKLSDLSRAPTWIQRTEQTSELINRGLTLPLRALQLSAKVAASPRILAFDAEQYAQDKILFPKAWKDTANAAEWSRVSHRPGTIGNFMFQFLPDSALKTAAQDIVNFGAYSVVPDPLAAAGRTLAVARSAEGATGVLGHFFSGTAFDKAYTAYHQYPTVRWGINFIADHNAGEVMRWNPRLAEVAGELDKLKVYDVGTHELDKPQTVQNVLDFFANKDSAQLITRTSTLPMYNFGGFLKESFRDLPGFRNFTNIPMFQEGTGFVAHEYSVGDKAAIPAIGQSLLHAGYDAKRVEAVMTELAHTDDPRVWRTAVANAYTGIFQARAFKLFTNAGLAERDVNAAYTELMARVDEHVADMVGTPTGDKRGMYGMGRDSTPLSPVWTTDGQGIVNGSRQAALYPEQLEKMVLPNYHQITTDMNRMVVSMKRALNKAEVNIDGVRMYRVNGRIVRYSGDVVRDTVNHYVNDVYFKPVALATGGWAFRVSVSEVIPNLYRQGGIKTIAAHFAVGAAEKTLELQRYVERLKLGKGTTDMERAVVDDTASHAAAWFKSNDVPLLPPREMTHFVAALYAVRLGFDRAVVKNLGEADLLEAASASIFLNNGHVAPAGMLSNHSGAFVEIPEEKETVGQLRNAAQDSPGHADTTTSQRVILDQRYTAYEHHEIGFQGLRHQRALFLQRSEWGQPLVETYHTTFTRTGSMEEALAATEQRALSLINEYGDKYRNFDRSHLLGQEDAHGVLQSTGDPKLDHANWLAQDVQGFLMGPVRDAKDTRMEGALTADRRYYDAASGNAIAKGQVPANLSEFRTLVHSGVPNEFFNTVVGPAIKDFRAGWSPRGIADILQRNVLGKIVNNLSRDPTYLIEFAKERRLLTDNVASGRMTQAEADVLAQTRAVAQMSRFIHNPLDKTKFDEAMRVVAPFYFAQMQAWRRAARLFGENPGAFEQLIKTYMGATKGITKLPNGYFTIPLLNSYLSAPLLGSANLAQSVDPLSPTNDPLDMNGPPTTMGQIAGMVTPSLGPIGTLPVQGFERVWIDSGWHADLAHQVARRVLGPLDETTPMWMQFLPNSTFQHIAEGVAGYAGWQSSTPSGAAAPAGVASTYASAQIEVASSLVETEIQKTMARIKPYVDRGVAPPGTPQSLVGLLGVTDKSQALYALAYGTVMQSLQTNTGARDAFMSNVNFQTAKIWTVKTVLGFFAPFGISVGQPNPQIATAYNALLKQFNNDALTASDALAAKYPWAMPATVSHSTNVTGLSYPESPQAADWYLNNKASIEKYPEAMAAMVPFADRNGAFDTFSELTTFSMDLRQRDTPGEFLDALQNALGGYVAYNVIDKAAAKQVADGHLTSYQAFTSYVNPATGLTVHGGWRQLQVNDYGNAYNSQWLDYENSGEGKAKRVQALQQFVDMGNDPQFANNTAVQLLAALAPAGLKVGYTENIAWNNLLNQFEAGNFKGANWSVTDAMSLSARKALGKQLSYAIDAVFRPMAPLYAPGT